MRELIGLAIMLAVCVIVVTVIHRVDVARDQLCISACQTAGGNGSYSRRVEHIDGKATRVELLCFADDDKLIVIPSPN